MSKQTASLPESVAISPIKMNTTALNRLLDELDAEKIIPPRDNRAAKRVRCRRTAIIVIVNQHGYESTFLIPVRDVSPSGVAFLHRSMLHKDTECTVRIRTPKMRWLQVDGKVVRSRYIRDMIYEVGLRFNHQVDFERHGLFTANEVECPRAGQNTRYASSRVTKSGSNSSRVARSSRQR